MPNLTHETQPLSHFQTNSAELLDQLHTTQRPITLTIDGEPKAILQDPAAYQPFLDLAAEADASEGIRQGLEDEMLSLRAPAIVRTWARNRASIRRQHLTNLPPDRAPIRSIRHKPQSHHH